VNEAAYAQSKADFISKLSIALKEANETKYWLLLLKETDYLEADLFESVSADCEELIKILAASIITAKNTLNKK
jgi:four helix bundle protein